MSKLDDLINKLCPDGVEYKRIENVCEISRGIVMSKDYIRDNAGNYPVYSSQTENDGCLGNINTYKYDGEYLTWTTDGANAGTVFYRTGKFSVTNVCGLLKVVDSNLSTKFLFYALSITAPNFVNRGMGNAKLMSNVMSSIQIPVPPLEIQNEIVRILDKFTLLEAELEAELEARRKQYEYYRDSLLTFGDDVEWKSLSEVTTSIKNIKWKQETNSFQYIDLSSVDRDTHSIGETTSINPETAPSRAQQIVNENDVLFGGTRPMLKRFCLISDKYNNQICSTGFCVLRANPEKILPKWIYYNLGTDAFYKHVEQYQSGASYPAISDGDVKRYKIAIPSLEEQEKIINLLDRFESLCNDITSGLPAEIEARHKQYEYYRDKLLTFKKKGA